MRYVIIGAGPAGIEAARAIRASDPSGHITAISKEPETPYSRVLLTHFLGGLHEDRLRIWGAAPFGDIGADYVSGMGAASIDTKSRQVHLEDGRALGFDRLLIASGADAVPLSIPGSNLPGITVLRTLAHAREISRSVRPGQSAIIVGGGFVSLKTAEALQGSGLKVTVVIASPRVLSQSLGPRPAVLVAGHLERRGIRVLTGTDVKAFTGENRVVEALLTDGSSMPCDIAVIGKGVRPALGFLKGSGISTNYGVIVDDRLMTSQEGIYAAGDVVEGIDQATGERKVNSLWPNAVEQGRLAGRNMAGDNLIYHGCVSMNITSLLGLAIMSCGVTRPETGDEVVGAHFGPNCYRELIFRNNVLIGAAQIGSGPNPGPIFRAVRNGTAHVYSAGVLLSKKVSYADLAAISGERAYTA